MFQLFTYSSLKNNEWVPLRRYYYNIYSSLLQIVFGQRLCVLHVPRQTDNRPWHWQPSHHSFVLRRRTRYIPHVVLTKARARGSEKGWSFSVGFKGVLHRRGRAERSIHQVSETCHQTKNFDAVSLVLLFWWVFLHTWHKIAKTISSSIWHMMRLFVWVIHMFYIIYVTWWRHTIHSPLRQLPLFSWRGWGGNKN